MNRSDLKARVFVCWSGARGQTVARSLVSLLEAAIPAIRKKVFYSPQLDKGVRWFEEIFARLEGAEAGVVCLTGESLASPWLHFEAGMLANGLHRSTRNARSGPLARRLFTFLHRAVPARLEGPLAQYQSTLGMREDTWRLVQSLADVLGETADPHSFPKLWSEFERALGRATVPVQDLVPDFERWFRRKTFDEPLTQCTDQNWATRFAGARETHGRVMTLDRVREACPRYQADLLDELRASVDSYSMDIRALLLGAKPFKLGASGKLDVPAGILQACENRRLRIKELVSRLLDPLAVPETEEAAAFWLTDSFEQRKMLVHRREHAILGHPERARARGRRTHRRRAWARVADGKSIRPKVVGELPEPAAALGLFDSVWELDRIFGYLLVEHLYPDAPEVDPDPAKAIEPLRQALVAELERFRAKREGASLMPVHYALGALKAGLRHRRSAPRSDRAAAGVEALLHDLSALIERSRGRRHGPELDRGGQVRREIREIRALLQPSRRLSIEGAKPALHRRRLALAGRGGPSARSTPTPRAPKR